VSSALANPFGDDEVDFPVQKYIADLRGIVALLSKNMQWQHKKIELTMAEPPSSSLAQQQQQQDEAYAQEAEQQRNHEMQQYEDYARAHFDAWQQQQQQQQYEQGQAYDANYGEPYYVPAQRPPQRWGRHVGLCSPKYMPRQGGGGAPLPPIGANAEAMGMGQNGYYVSEAQQMGRRQ